MVVRALRPHRRGLGDRRLVARSRSFGHLVPAAAPATLVNKERTRMLLDVRTYTCRPGTIKAHVALYEKLGKTPQTRHLGQPLAWLVTETGDVNQYIHIWVYENAGDREKRRAAMWADPEWVAYTQESAKLGALVKQENRLMTPVDFFPLRR